VTFHACWRDVGDVPSCRGRHVGDVHACAARCGRGCNAACGVRVQVETVTGGPVSTAPQRANTAGHSPAGRSCSLVFSARPVCRRGSDAGKAAGRAERGGGALHCTGVEDASELSIPAVFSQAIRKSSWRCCGPRTEMERARAHFGPSCALFVVSFVSQQGVHRSVRHAFAELLP